MEHRYTDRKPMVLDVVVVCPCLGLVRGKSVNLGSGGMFVETGCVTMPINAPVQVCFQAEQASSGEKHEISGMVVHLKGQGFGMMFDELDAGSRRLLSSLLAENSSKASHHDAQRMHMPATA